MNFTGVSLITMYSLPDVSSFLVPGSLKEEQYLKRLNSMTGEIFLLTNVV